MEMRHHHPPLSLTQSRTWLSESRRRLGRGLACRVKRFSLDRALSRGEDPGSDPMLAQRADQLRSAGMRRGLAADLRDLVERADKPAGLSCAAPVAPSVRTLADTVLRIARRLETDPGVGVRGLAMISLLLRDDSSPFWSGTEEELEDALKAVMIGLGS
jgi:hypothetical protein